MFKKKWHWFSVTLMYVSKRGELISERTIMIGKKKKNQILSHRDTNKFSGPEFIRGIPKHALCNGVINLKVNAYLGRMPQREN